MNEITEILARYTDLKPDEIRPDSTLVQDLGLTSLDVLDMVADFEDTFDLEIPDKDIKKLETVQDIADYIKRQTA